MGTMECSPGCLYVRLVVNSVCGSGLTQKVEEPISLCILNNNLHLRLGEDYGNDKLRGRLRTRFTNKSNTSDKSEHTTDFLNAKKVLYY